MAIHYPRKQTVIIFVVCIVLVGLAIHYTHTDSNTEQAQNIQGLTASSSTMDDSPQILTNIDWKKQFLDASSSANTFKAVAKNTSSSTQDEHLTATDQLARDFFTKYMELRQNGLNTNQDAINATVNQLIDTSAANTQLPKPFTVSDIHTIAVINNSILTEYGQAIKTIEWTYIPTQDNNEAVIAEKALEQGDMSLLKNIDPVIVNYQAAIKMLSSMNVPQPLAEYHVGLMNGINVALFNAKALRHVDTDPVSGVSAVNLEMASLSAMDNAATGITQYLSNNGISIAI